jgi:O-antigen ligase
MSIHRHPDWDGVLQEETALTTNARKVTLAGLVLVMGGLVTSPAILSIGVVTTFLPAFVAYPLREQWRRFWGLKPAVLLSLIFLLQIVSGIWTRDTSVDIWLDLIKIKAPLLLTTYGFAVLGPFSLRWVRRLLMLLLATCTVAALGTVIGYLSDKAAIDEMIQSSKEITVWTGINHIYFSVICGFTVLSAVWMLFFKNPALFRGEKWLVIGLGLANFLMMHILTTRTGLVGMYATGVLLGFVWVMRERRYLAGVIALIVILAMPLVGYYQLSSFQHRLDNTVVDLTRYFAGKDPNYLSIGTRFESWKAAIHIFQRHPVIGVGMGDIKEAMIAQYLRDETKLCPENFVMPHNQFLLNLAGFGLLGLGLFVIGWFYPVFQRRIPLTWLFWGLWILMTLAMLGESMMERQVGVNFVVTVLMLSLGTGVNWPGQDRAAWR